MLPLLLFFICWIAGQGLLFLYLRNQNNNLAFHDVVNSFVLSTAVGFVFAFAAWKANILHWTTVIAMIGLASYITYKMLEKGKANSGSVASKLFNKPNAVVAAEARENLIFAIVAGAIYLLVTLCFTSFDTYMHGCYLRQGAIVHIIGIILVVASYFMVFNSAKAVFAAQSGFVYWIAVIVLFALGLCTMCGFNFDLHGIEPSA